LAEDSSAQGAREAVAVFHQVAPYQAAIDELSDAGFDRADLSLLASQQAVEEKLGHAYTKVTEVEADATVPRAAYADDASVAEARTGVIGGLAYIGAMAALGVVVASGGGLAAAIAAAAVAGGGGGVLGAVAARFIGKDHAANLQAQLDKGGLLLWVRIADASHEQKALEILKKHGGEDVHVHDLPASDQPDENPLGGIQIDPALPGAKI
jgi:outer membrane lipoprotein SlyB